MAPGKDTRVRHSAPIANTENLLKPGRVLQQQLLKNGLHLQACLPLRRTIASPGNVNATGSQQCFFLALGKL
jgi:hypothetical protein